MWQRFVQVIKEGGSGAHNASEKTEEILDVEASRDSEEIDNASIVHDYISFSVNY